MDIVVNQPKHWNADFQISFKGFNKTIAIKELQYLGNKVICEVKDKLTQFSKCRRNQWLSEVKNPLT